MPTSRSVVVHLVHGTWPFGLFRRSSGGTTKAWFEDDSTVRRAIESYLRCQVEFRVFAWSGHNSFFARQEASVEFDRHLDGAMREDPDTVHVVVAHSHGGTIAAHALARRTRLMRGECRVKALICLATPFAYLTSISRADDFLFFTATGAILSALVLALIPLGNPWLVLAFALGGPLLAVPIFRWRTYFADRHTFHPIAPSVAIFLIRATRDEATLSIGLTQALHALSQAVYRLFDSNPSIRSPFSFLFSHAVGLTFLVMGIVAAKWKAQDQLFDAWQYVVFYPMAFAAGAAGVIYVGGYALIALAVGFTDLRLWPASIEVDAAPPNRECTVLSLSLEGDETAGLRHGIYELESVQREVASIIQSVADGSPPSLVKLPDNFLVDLQSPHWVVRPLNEDNRDLNQS